MSILTLFSTEFTKALAKYPLTSSLIDIIRNQSGALTRSTTKHFSNDSGVYSTAAIDSAAFTGSGVLLEPADTNINTYSSDISNAGYTKTRLTATAATVAGPDGATSAGELTVTATSGSGASFTKTYTISSGQQQTIKLVVKYDNCAYLGLQAFNLALTSGTDQFFKLSTGTLGVYNSNVGSGWSVASKSIVARSDGYYEITMVVNTTGTGMYFAAYLCNADSSYACVSGQKVNYYNLSIQSANTSSIKTTTTALTRTSEALTVPTSGWKNNEFGLYFRYKPVVVNSGIVYLFYDYVDANNYIYIRLLNSTTIGYKSVQGGVTVLNYTQTITQTAGVAFGVLVTYSSLGCILKVDGVGASAGAVTSNFSHVANAIIGSDGSTGSINGVISDFKYINTADITYAQAEAL